MLSKNENAEELLSNERERDNSRLKKKKKNKQFTR